MAETYAQAKQKLTDAISRNIQRGSEVGSSVDKNLISLSGGALVFSMTFVDKLAPHKLILPVLFSAWTAFTACMIFVLFSMIYLQVGLSKTFNTLVQQINDVEAAERAGVRVSHPTKAIRYSKVKALNSLAVGSFIVGVLLLGFFVAYNISAR
jgi:hypothetical protein